MYYYPEKLNIKNIVSKNDIVFSILDVFLTNSNEEFDKTTGTTMLIIYIVVTQKLSKIFE